MTLGSMRAEGLAARMGKIPGKAEGTAGNSSACGEPSAGRRRRDRSPGVRDWSRADLSWSGMLLDQRKIGRDQRDSPLYRRKRMTARRNFHSPQSRGTGSRVGGRGVWLEGKGIVVGSEGSQTKFLGHPWARESRVGARQLPGEARLSRPNVGCAVASRDLKARPRPLCGPRYGSTALGITSGAGNE